MQTKTPILTKANQHYQVTIPAQIRKKMPFNQGDLFTIENVKKGILLKPVTMIETEEYADPMTPEEEEAVKEALEDMKAGRYTTLRTSDEVKKHFDSLKK